MRGYLNFTLLKKSPKFYFCFLIFWGGEPERGGAMDDAPMGKRRPPDERRRDRRFKIEQRGGGNSLHSIVG